MRGRVALFVISIVCLALLLITFAGKDTLLVFDTIAPLGTTLPLADLPRISKADYESAIAPLKKTAYLQLSLSQDGYTLPKDVETNVFYCSSMDAVTLTVGKGVSAFLADGETTDHFILLLRKNNRYTPYSVVETGIPIVRVASRKPIGSATEMYRTTQETSIAVFTDTGVETVSLAEIRTRGRSSLQAYPKNSYSLVLRNPINGAKAPASLLGLDASLKYSLNSIYEDPSKIRDHFALTLWKKLSKSEGGAYPYMDSTMVELVLDGRYRGLYALHQTPECASLLAGKSEGAVVKVRTHAIPDNEIYDPYNTNFSVDTLSPIDDAWAWFTAFADCVHDPSSTEEELMGFVNRPCYIDYILYLNLLRVYDNCWKNMGFIFPNAEGNNIYCMPWDVDLSVGLRFNSGHVMAREDADCYADIPEPVGVDSFWERFSPETKKECAARWFELRAGLFSEEALLQMSREMYSLISDTGALRRDAIQWPRTATSENNSYFETFMHNRIEYLDEWFTLLASEAVG